MSGEQPVGAAAPAPDTGSAPEQASAAAGARDPRVPLDAPAAPAARDPRAPWWFEGVRFGCTACGKCCRNHGEGFEYVYSTRTERRALAEHFGISQREFEARYCERIEGHQSFKSKDGGCVFLEQGRCSVYELRPSQCRTFPFWPELLVDERTWERDVASFCPGVGQGPLHDANAIRARLHDNP